MARRQNATTAALAEEPDPPVELDGEASMARHEEIAQLAYSYWQARGCPHGSPDEDWFRAEAELKTSQQSQSEQQPMTAAGGA